MEWQRLEQLKQKVQADDDFSATWKFFFDHLGENQQFVLSGRQADQTVIDKLETIVESVVKRIVDDEVMVAQMMLTEVPDHHFFHGPCLTDAGLCVVLYFSDVQQGMISFTQGRGSGWVHYARFTTLTEADKNSMIVPNPSQTGH